MTKSRVLNASFALLLPLVLAGCSSWAQRSDKVFPKMGNAVKANLAIHTTNPSSKQANDVSGLGQDGFVVPTKEEITP